MGPCPAAIYGDAVGGVPAGVCAPETGPDSQGLGCAGVAAPDDDREEGRMGGRFLPVGKGAAKSDRTQRTSLFSSKKEAKKVLTGVKMLPRASRRASLCCCCAFAVASWSPGVDPPGVGPIGMGSEGRL